jgi:hypothetical protein
LKTFHQHKEMSNIGFLGKGLGKGGFKTPPENKSASKRI